MFIQKSKGGFFKRKYVNYIPEPEKFKVKSVQAANVPLTPNPANVFRIHAHPDYVSKPYENNIAVLLVSYYIIN